MYDTYDQHDAHALIRVPMTSMTLTCDVEDGFEESFTAVRQIPNLGVRVEAKLWWTFGW